MHEISTVIEKNGKTTITVKGVKGSGCKALTADYVSKLGTVTSDKATPEMYEQEQTNVARNRA